MRLEHRIFLSKHHHDRRGDRWLLTLAAICVVVWALVLGVWR